MSAEDVYKQLLKENLDVGLATVYRVLTQFEAAGILVRHHFGSGKSAQRLARLVKGMPKEVEGVTLNHKVNRAGKSTPGP